MHYCALQKESKGMEDDLIFIMSVHIFELFLVDIFNKHIFALYVLIGISNTVLTMYYYYKHRK